MEIQSLLARFRLEHVTWADPFDYSEEKIDLQDEKLEFGKIV